MSYRVGRRHAPPTTLLAALAATRYSSAQQTDPVSTERLSIEDALTPEDEAELEDLHEDEAETSE